MHACVLVVWVRAVSRLEQAFGGVTRQSRGWLVASAAKHGNHVVDHCERFVMVTGRFDKQLHI